MVIVFGVRAGHATVLLDEPFDYPDGTLVAVSGGVWSTHSGTTGQVEVNSGRADLGAPRSEDVNALLSQSFAATANTNLYASFTVRFSASPSPSGQYFAHFKDNGTVNFRAKIFAQASTSAGPFTIGIANGSNFPTAIYPLELNLNTDYRVYIRYGVSNASATLWLNPISEASPSVTATDSVPARAVTSFALREDSGMGAMQIDDLRVGTEFADVFFVVPPTIIQQPASTVSVQGGAASFSVVAAGTEPLGYQWQFNSTNLADATNSSLILTNLTAAQAGLYSVIVTNAAGATNSEPATLTVFEPSASGTLSVVTYNLKGNFASDWSVDAPQVQAIARELLYLNPDIIAVNEIPNGLRHQMTNWMSAFFPTYTLAVSTNTDGAIRNGFISRYPITRSQSWLAHASLTNFGYAGTFTRDLFEAEITVPGASEPLHAFTTHLKSGPDADSQNRRAAECSAISNFFATVFIPTNGSRPYFLTGDMNEDIAIPLNQSNQPIQQLISAPTGLQLTTPLNPFTLSRFTHSIQGSLDARFDYILPCGFLFSNMVYSEVFRTDLLPSPPPPLQTNDDLIASDHLPVLMIFNYPDPPLQVDATLSNQSVVLRWPTLVSRGFNVEESADFTNWSVAVSNVVSQSPETSWTVPAEMSSQFFRVMRLP